MAETVTQSKPFKQFKPGYRILGREAPKLYKKTDSKPWEGDRVANFNQAQRDAFDTIGGVANANTEYSQNMLGQLGGIAGSDGLAQGMGQSLNWIDKVGTGQDKIETGQDYAQLGKDYNQVANQMVKLGDNADKYSGVGDYKDLMGSANDKFYSEQNLKGMAQGDLVGAGNPYLNDMVNLAGDRITNDLNARMAGSGSYGGSRYYNNMAKGLSDSELGLRYQAYGDERNRQLQANQMLDAAQGQRFGQEATATQGLANSRQTDFGNQIGAANAQMGALSGKNTALGGQTAVQGQNIANTLTAANQQAGILQQGQANRLAALGLSPELQQTSLLGGQALLGIGDRMQGQDQKEADAQMQYYNENRDQDWTQLSKLGQALGMGSQYGTQTQTQNANILEQILGGITGAGALFGSIF